MKSEDYVNIQGWMITELGLKGNDLMVYAIIYGFSKDDTSKFYGSIQYLADWCNCTKQGIQKNLKNLIEKGLIVKKEEFRNGVKFCEYSCTPYNLVAHPIQQSCMAGQQSCINNIVNNQEEILEDTIIGNNSTEILENDDADVLADDMDDFESHSYSIDELKQEHFDSMRSKKPKSEKQSIYGQCVEEINSYTQDLTLHSLLCQYLNLRISIRTKPLRGVNQWKGILDKLTEIVKENPGTNYEDVVKQSIERGYASFFPLNRKKKEEVFSEFGMVHSIPEREENITDAEY